MAHKARLFEVADVVSALTGAPLNAGAKRRSIEILSYVTGKPASELKSDCSHSYALRCLKEQLSTSLAEFTILDLARLVSDVMIDVGSENARTITIKKLCSLFGGTIVITPQIYFKEKSAEITQLETIARLEKSGDTQGQPPVRLAEKRNHNNKNANIRSS